VTAAEAIVAARKAGVRLKLTASGTLELEAAAPPPAELLAELRRWRDQIVDLLAAQDIPSDAGGLVGDDDDPERRAMLAHYSAEPSARPYKPSDADEYRDGLRISALMRPPSWAGSTPPPPKGAWCGCRNRTHRSGGRWWRPRHPRTDGTGLAPGWRCMTCHPPPASSEVEEVRT
jgi:hypothetical protein